MRSLLKGSTLALTFALLAPMALTQDLPSVPTDIPESYRQRELQASISTRQDLNTLRAQGVEKGWTFKVGATSAFPRPLSELAATTIPEGFLGLAAAQDEQSRRTNGIARESALLAGVSQKQYLLSCNPNLQAFNWRDTEKRMTPIRNQQSCGSCWA